MKNLFDLTSPTIKVVLKTSCEYAIKLIDDDKWFIVDSIQTTFIDVDKTTGRQLRVKDTGFWLNSGNDVCRRNIVTNMGTIVTRSRGELLKVFLRNKNLSKIAEFDTIDEVRNFVLSENKA